MSFSESSKRHLYLACVKSRFCEYFKNKIDTKWRSHLLVPDVQLPSWHLFYKSPLPKRSGDIQWSILHCALATHNFLYKYNLNTSLVCKLCNVPVSRYTRGSRNEETRIVTNRVFIEEQTEEIQEHREGHLYRFAR